MGNDELSRLVVELALKDEFCTVVAQHDPIAHLQPDIPQALPIYKSAIELFRSQRIH